LIPGIEGIYTNQKQKSVSGISLIVLCWKTNAVVYKQRIVHAVRKSFMMTSSADGRLRVPARAVSTHKGFGCQAANVLTPPLRAWQSYKAGKLQFAEGRPVDEQPFDRA
jgi:hypothetical protein